MADRSRQVFELTRTLALFKRALRLGGERRGLTDVYWDISGRCIAPRTRYISGVIPKGVLRGIGERGKVMEFPEDGQPMTLEMDTACRQCTACLFERAKEWRTRCYRETEDSVRTWFGTLTLSPDYQALFAAMAAKQHPEFEGLSGHKQLALRHEFIGPELTKYLKRIRKESGAELKYCLVLEAHKSGLPHYHILIHETNPAKPIRHEVLKDQWKLGFTKFKLADPRTASYVAKYLSKTAAARVRASVGYGKKRLSIARVSKA
nr:MAG: replication initiator protein [Microvirus sp.]